MQEEKPFISYLFTKFNGIGAFVGFVYLLFQIANSSDILLTAAMIDETEHSFFSSNSINSAASNKEWTAHI